MNYYKARERKDGRWDYTVMNDGNVRPTGYCGEYIEWTQEMLDHVGLSSTSSMILKEGAFAHKHHTTGHDSQEAACSCYKQYLLDHFLVLDVSVTSPGKCDWCGHTTFLTARVQDTCFYLCRTHNKREIVENLFPTPGESWES